MFFFAACCNGVFYPLEYCRCFLCVDAGKAVGCVKLFPVMIAFACNAGDSNDCGYDYVCCDITCLFGGYWWLAKTCLFLVTQPLTNQLLTKFCSVRQIPEGTKTGQNHRKIKSRTPCSEYPHLNICYSGAKVQICPVKNESKRIKFTSIVHFLFSCTTMDNTNRFLPRLDGLAPKSRVKICFVASGSHVRRKCVGLYRHSARSFAGKRKPCIFKYRKLDETDTEKVSDRPTDNLPADGRKSRQMGKLNIYKSIISR